MNTMTSSNESAFPFSDIALARRLERGEAVASARFVEGRAELFPNSGARWIDIAGAYAMYDGVSSPLTQTFGLGLFDPVTERELEALERFYQDCGAPVFHEVSPLAGTEVLSLLADQGYKPIELTSVMYRTISDRLVLAGRPPAEIRARTSGAKEQQLWAETAARGWSEIGDLSDFMRQMAQISDRAEGVVRFLAENNGAAIAAGTLSITGGVGLLAGASTVPEARRQGAQLALLEARLRYAFERGCDLAMMCAHPGSASQRNAERHGFRIAYTRTKWQKPADNG
jgi:GNAT superfamily N-acetyltransferase